jgi:actin-related protein
VSLLNRINLGEYFFGNINNDELNIAYSLLKVLMNLPNEDRNKLCRNIVISGGGSMAVGFYKRLVRF